MPLQVIAATEADALRIVELEQLAYKDDVLTPILFPGPFPEGAAGKQADEMVHQLHADPTARWLKVVDNESQEMIAFAKWNVYEPGKPRPTVPPRTFGEGCNQAACKQFWGLMDEKRQHHMGKIPHVCEISSSNSVSHSAHWTGLDLLQTDPQHQRRGAGSMLIKRFIDVADQLKIHAYLESSPMGQGLYTKLGFEVFDEMMFDMEAWGGSGTHTTTYMLRPIPQ